MTQEKNRKKLYITILWTVFFSPLLLITTVFILIGRGVIGFIPDFSELENPENNLASVLISEDGEDIGKYFIENRIFTEYENLSPYLVNALIATEDIRFDKHSGIDARGLARVLVRTIIGGQNTGGGSTLTQQLAKNLYKTREYNRKSRIGRSIEMVVIKLSEWVTAARLERFYTKKEILVMYLNTVPFGHETFGIRSASRVFFDSTPDSLKVEEAALLVGTLKAQTYYSPILNPDNALRRRNVVLSQMEKYGFLTPEGGDSLKQLPIELNYQTQGHLTGLAPHFRTFLRKQLMASKPEKEDYYSYSSFQYDSTEWENSALYGWANKNFKPDGSAYNIYTDGLRIYTSLNSSMQRYAENAVNKHLGEQLQKEFFVEKKLERYPPFSNDLEKEQVDQIMRVAMARTERYRKLRAKGVSRDSIVEVFTTPVPMQVFTWSGKRDTVMSPMDSLRYYKHFLRAGFMAMEPGTGYVRAYVGGHNYRYFMYDQVTQGKRQVGSTIKPFLYTLAMSEGFSPCDRVPNVPVSFEANDSTWTPRNSGKFEMEGKMVTLEWGLANSVNYISAFLVKQFNPQAIVGMIKKMGVSSFVDPVPSIFLGTSDISLEEMVAAFNVYSNKGVYIEPVYITRIEDRHGNVISEFHPKQKEAISEKAAYLMVQLLKNVVNRGTAGKLRWFFNLEAALGGKTGTTQNHSDGWYMGISPKLTAGVWVGAEDRSVRFRTLGKGSGSYMALPVYGYFMQQVYADSTLGIFQEDIWEKPEGFAMELDCPDIDREAGIQSIEFYEEPEDFR